MQPSTKLLPFVTTRMDPYGVVLTEISWRKTNIVKISLTCRILKHQIHRSRAQTGLCQRQEVRDGGWVKVVKSYKHVAIG